MTLSPRTPQRIGCAPVNFPSRGKAARGPFFQKVRTEKSVDPWIDGMYKANLLLLESFSCRIRSRFPRVAPFHPLVSRFAPHSIFSVSTSLSLSNLLKREREIGLEGGEILGVRIHGFALLSKKASTGFQAIHGLIRGNPWMTIIKRNNHLTTVSGGIHGSTGCAACGLPRSIF